MDNGDKSQVERSMMENLLFAHLKEQRDARRWKIFFRIVGLLLVLFVLMVSFKGPKKVEINEEHIAVIDIKGTIAEGEKASAVNINKALEKAFTNKKVVAVVLAINSPGGSPVQADLVNSKIQKLKQKYKKPIYSVATEVCASAAYYIAVAADEIYANNSSIVGSIGVILSGFGFDEAMKKVGVDRRLYTAGKHKALLDPFSPKSAQQDEHIKTLLDDMHQQFINVVKNGRGNKINIPEEEAFSGLAWSGKQAKEKGLIDKLGSLDDIKELFEYKYKTYDYSVYDNYLDTLFKKIATQTKATIYNSLVNSLGFI